MFSRLTDRLEVDMESLLSSSSNNNSNNSQEEEEELLSFLPSLTWQERLGGCLACMALGYILSLGSFFRLKDLLHGNPTSFVLCKWNRKHYVATYPLFGDVTSHIASLMHRPSRYHSGKYNLFERLVFFIGTKDADE